jgi:hypothetical protein
MDIAPQQWALNAREPSMLSKLDLIVIAFSLVGGSVMIEDRNRTIIDAPEEVETVISVAVPTGCIDRPGPRRAADGAEGEAGVVVGVRGNQDELEARGGLPACEDR